MPSLLQRFARTRESAGQRLAFGALVAVALGAGGWGLGAMTSRHQVVMHDRKGGSITVSTDLLLDWPLQDLKSGARVQAGTGKDYQLLIVLSAMDCSSCLLETEQWNQLAHRHAARLDVRAVVINSTHDEIHDYVTGFTAAFPVYVAADQAAPLWHRLEGVTPIKILVDKHRRPVLAETGGAPWNTFAQRVTAAIEGTRQPPSLLPVR